ncbi:hypothetical protein [Myxacorys almedinensis]|uniref:Uncharacterized protein n=1 Tax=Myxacorys almedinensis A TaxID=2690445 RepID=A0A8J8CMK2_9CYAN|nr:hypothetical protein [Myxacorys almedinensis]NDJ17372.1 hypothetical protein [Myxacorys almedinensis A]
MSKFGASSAFYYLLPLLVIFISFRAFAGFLTPDFDADQAIHVLMANDLKLPDDLYFWGQSRLGSLLPIVSHLILKIVSISPLKAVSYVHFLLLLTGYFCFASLLSRGLSRVILALVWFLPATPFMKVVEVAHPYSPQFALFGIAVIFAQNLMQTSARKSYESRIFILIIISALLLSVWVSELSIAPVLLAIILILVRFFRNYRTAKFRAIAPQSSSLRQINLFKSNLLYALIILLAWVAFLAYAKLTASPEDIKVGFAQINNLSIIVEIIQVAFTSTLSVLLFQANNLFLSLHSITSLIAIGAIIKYIFHAYCHQSFTLPLSPQLKWAMFFLMSAFLTFLLILASYWTYYQSVPSRYFIVVYLFVWISALLIVEHFHCLSISQTVLKRMNALLLITALLGSFSLPGYVFSLEKPLSKSAQLQPLEALGQAGFIGNYWASYLMCIPNPSLLSCTPHDQDYVRCDRCVTQVLNSPVIYLVKNDWLNTFPEEIEQFGQHLRKHGAENIIAGYTIAPYQKVLNKQ